MTRTQVASALQSSLGPAETIDDAQGCAIVTAPKQPGMYFRFDRSILEAITIVAPSRISTLKHVGIGSSAFALHRAYGSMLRGHPKYDYAPGGREDLVYWPKSGGRGVRFMVGQDRRVEAIIAGTETIFLVDGCE